jgi:hypothetical protein
MLPEGAAADLAPPLIRDPLLEHHLPARTVVELRRGSCACDLLGLDGGAKHQERELRRRYRTLGATRDQTIAALEQHRRPRLRLAQPVAWPELLAGFVAEHARNAGPALYLLQFAARHPARLPRPLVDSRITAARVRADPRDWLVLDQATLVEP